MNHIVIELANMPALTIVMPVSEPAPTSDPMNSDTTISLLDIIEIILNIIVDGVTAVFPTRQEDKL